MKHRRSRQAGVVIDCFPESVARYRDTHVIVAVDVIRATTTAVTAAVEGWACHPVGTLDEAMALADDLPDAMLAGELGGSIPYGFDFNNSPAAIAAYEDRSRPLILLSTSGTRVVTEAVGAPEVLVGCLRNAAATAVVAAAFGAPVAVIGAGARGEFRLEDQLCAARIVRGLVDAGMAIGSATTGALLERWDDAPVEAMLASKSVTYLQDTGQLADLEFVLTHVEDLAAAHVIRAGVVEQVPVPELDQRPTTPARQ